MFIKVNRIVIVPTVNLWLSSRVILNHFIGSTVLTLPKDKYWYAVDDTVEGLLGAESFTYT